MKISGLQIKNFKAIAKHRFELTSLNVFLGKNSMGKSSTLQALLLIKDNFEEREIVDLITDVDLSLSVMLNLRTRFLDLGFSNEVFKADENDEKIVFILETGRTGILTIESEFESGEDYLISNNTIRQSNSKCVLGLRKLNPMNGIQTSTDLFGKPIFMKINGMPQ